MNTTDESLNNPGHSLTTRNTFRNRATLFIVLVVVAATAGTLVVLRSGQHPTSPVDGEQAASDRTTTPVRYIELTDTNLGQLLSKPHFLSVRYPRDTGEPYSLEVVPAHDPTLPRIRSKLSCLNVHFRAGRGLCVMPPTDALGTTIQVLDDRLNVTSKLTLAGSPSRARMSPNGIYGAVTNFLSGHSYADTNFSTATTIIDFATGTSSNLETWATFNGINRIGDKSRNFWGTSFLTDNTFYVSMGIGSDRYLLKGDTQSRELRVISTHMECPSVAPDGRHLTFRRGIVETNGSTSMPLFLLDLTTMREQRLTYNETVDGQPEWLDNHRIAIGTPTGPPNIAVIDIDVPHTGPETWTTLVSDALSATYVNPRIAESGT
jgi:hypothetical protein